jgi:hypothetical protein
VRCWGSDLHGELGDGFDAWRRKPVKIVGPPAQAYSYVETTGHHSCALTGAGALACWGENSQGELGNSTTKPGLANLLPGPYTALHLGPGYTCALQGAPGTATLWCWGKYPGVTQAALMPVPMGTASDWIDLATSAGAMCGLHGSPATLVCWGDAAVWTGGTSAQVTFANADVIGTGFSSFSLGAHHLCARAGGVTRCQGRNDTGQLGVDTGGAPAPTLSQSPVGAQLQSLSSAVDTTCAQLNSGSNLATCWGPLKSLWGAPATPAWQPEQVPGTPGLPVVGPTAMCGLKGGALECLGRNADHVLGLDLALDAIVKTPTALPGIGWQSVSLGDGVSCGVESGEALCWGRAGWALGDGRHFAPAPMPVTLR